MAGGVEGDRRTQESHRPVIPQTPWSPGSPLSLPSQSSVPVLFILLILFLCAFLAVMSLSQLHRPLLELRRAEAALGRSTWASCCFSSSSCREQALGEGAAVAEIDPRALEHRPLAVARGLRRSMACGLFAEQGSN